ncbi:globin C, coelomic-like [Pollicipes pollicipes]|uniref:globin C, coelomic-like n=1 Tax=Pollicipes pollicipes TaxID=41117 RepID=UPI00188553A5|nr:globin C, coelomic-like [Pollicipes pollicipes]
MVACRRLFDRYPETKAKFPRLNTSSPEVMRSSARVRAHAGRVVTSLGSIISALDDLEVVDETIFLLGESHNRRKVEAEDFQKFSRVFLDYLKDTLGETYTSDSAEAFTKLMGVFNKKMSLHLEQ